MNGLHKLIKIASKTTKSIIDIRDFIIHFGDFIIHFGVLSLKIQDSIIHFGGINSPLQK